MKVYFVQYYHPKSMKRILQALSLQKKAIKIANMKYFLRKNLKKCLKIALYR